MNYDDTVRCRVEGSFAGRIEEVADRTGLSESEVMRRLLRLGMADVDQIGDEALLTSAATGQNTEQPAK